MIASSNLTINIPRIRRVGNTREFKKKVGAVVKNIWVALASEKLNTTRQAYIQAIQDPEISGRRIVIRLKGKLATMIEEGQKAFDQKPGMLASSKAKTSADGKRYITVPLSQKTPGARGGRVMPPDIYAMAKRLALGRSLRGTEASYPPQQRAPITGRMSVLTSKMGFGPILRGTPDMKRFAQPYQHKSGPYEGMQRTGAKGHSQYNTFRTISDKSEAGSWLHPGIKARNFRPEVMKRFESIADSLIEDLLLEIGLA